MIEYLDKEDFISILKLYSDEHILNLYQKYNSKNAYITYFMELSNDIEEMKDNCFLNNTILVKKQFQKDLIKNFCFPIPCFYKFDINSYAYKRFYAVYKPRKTFIENSHEIVQTEEFINYFINCFEKHYDVNINKLYVNADCI